MCKCIQIKPDKTGFFYIFQNEKDLNQEMSLNIPENLQVSLQISLCTSENTLGLPIGNDLNHKYQNFFSDQKM